MNNCYQYYNNQCVQSYPFSINELNIYGDGSAGNLIISMTSNWITDPPPNNNFMFMNFTINDGIILTVASGTIIRVKQNFTNNGFIIVQPPLLGESVINPSGPEGTISPVYNQIVVAANSLMTPYQYQNNKVAKVYGGTAYPKAILINLLNPGILGGGNGAVGAYQTSSITAFGNTQAGGGGGTLSIYVKCTFINNGNISANGGKVPITSYGGNGGGAGGIIIIASKQNIVNNGSINANGSDGSTGIITFSQPNPHSGGGGGGGLIHILSPNANTLMNINVNGDNPGTSVGSDAGDYGGGGGAMGGDGGNGGFGKFAATAGSSGVVVFTTTSSPEYMLI